MIQSIWEAIPMYCERFDVDGVVVMPNHIHGIIIIKHDSNIIDSSVGDLMFLPDIVHRFKTLTTKNMQMA